ncbi:MAG TPA: glycosyltransferase family 2 protein [Gemmataceae bacterium]|nr:glycosyltransferase family 2 protein [Gemmataceae bacterium]
MPDTLLIILFWSCAGVVTFAYACYPVVVWLLARLFGRAPAPPPVESADLPAVSLLVAAHNEEADIEARIANALELRYPKGNLEVVIASDGSTDRTNEIVGRYADRDVRLLAYPVNRGKAAVLNAAVPRLHGQVVVLSDANTHMEPDAVWRLATWFADPSVGVVCGKLILTDSETGRNADGLYWKYETFLKECEGRLGALVGCNGAIYAIRKSLYPGGRGKAIIDDFVIPLEARRHSGCRIVFDPEALAREETAPNLRAEFRRRARIGAGGLQSMARLWPLLSPAHRWVSFTFLCHKVLRWLSPFCLVGMLIANLLLVGVSGYDYLLAAQGGFYLMAVAGARVPARPRAFRVLKLATMFVTMNLALLVGFLGWVTGAQRGTWQRTPRSPANYATRPRVDAGAA